MTNPGSMLWSARASLPIVPCLAEYARSRTCHTCKSRQWFVRLDLMGSVTFSVVMCMQEPNSRSSSVQKQQSRSSSTPVAIREDVLAADPSTGPRSRSLALEVCAVKVSFASHSCVDWACACDDCLPDLVACSALD